MMNHGKNCDSSTMPTIEPTPLATTAYTKYFEAMRPLE